MQRHLLFPILLFMLITWTRCLFRSAQWSEEVTKPSWSSAEQNEVHLSFLEAFGYILSKKVFLNIFKS